MNDIRYLDLDVEHLIDITKSKRCLDKLSYFVKEFWELVVPNDLVWNWHMDVLCDEVQQVDERVFKRQPKEYDLIFNLPPGTTKTQITSVMATCWDFARMPDIRIAVGSYSDSAVSGISDYIRLIMNSEKYQRYFPKTIIRRDKNNIHNFKTTANGEFYAFTVGGTITAKHFDILRVDDPIDPRRVSSRAELIKTNTVFFDKTLSSRKTIKEMTPLTLTMQRLATNDPTGHLLFKNDNIRHINIPARLSDQVKPSSLANMYVNGLLDANRLTEPILKDFEVQLGTAEFSAQFMQSPVPEGGNIIKKDWFWIVDADDLPMDFLDNPVMFFLDTAYTKEKVNDPSAMGAFTYYKGIIYIIDYWYDHLELNELVKKTVSTKDIYGDYRSMVHIEAKASALSLEQELKRLFASKINVKLVGVKGGKDDRLRAYSAAIESGKVALLRARWNNHFIDEVTGFPAMPHDEAVDVLTMACKYYLNTNEDQDIMVMM